MKFAIQFPLFVYARRNYPILQLFVWSEFFYLVKTVSGPDKRVFCPGTELASYQGGKPAVGPQRKSGQLGQDGAKSGRAAEAGHHQSHSCSGIQSPKVLALRSPCCRCDRPRENVREELCNNDASKIIIGVSRQLQMETLIYKFSEERRR